MKKIIPQKIKNIYHLLRSFFSAVWFGFPAKNLKVVGITGTNGKTTTTLMIGKILEEAGKKIAIASTINFKIDKEEWTNKTKFTTLSGWHLQKFIFKAKKAHCEYLVLEVGSHALDQNRVWGIEFNTAVITNITREHLDYHRTMENYRKAKRRLFESLKGGFLNWKINRGNFFLKKKKTKKIAIVNLAMEKPEDFLTVKADERYGYSAEIIGENSTSKRKDEKNCDCEKVLAKNIQASLSGSRFEVAIGEHYSNFAIHLPGYFNIENALAGICVGLSEGISLETCARALEKIEKIAGRMDYVKNDREIDIIIDYALTPDSMEKIGKLMTESLSQKKVGQNSKLIWVFGACGERDRGKRPMMGEIVSRYADVAIVTNEDPYGENPEDILDEIISGIVGEQNMEDNANLKLEKNKRFVQIWKILSRKSAIKKALDLARKGDVVLITGKGAEETMAIGEKRILWNDRRVIEGILKEENRG